MNTERIARGHPEASAVVLDPTATFAQVVTTNRGVSVTLYHRFWDFQGHGSGPTREEAWKLAQANFNAGWAITPYMRQTAAELSQFSTTSNP